MPQGIRAVADDGDLVLTNVSWTTVEAAGLQDLLWKNYIYYKYIYIPWAPRTYMFRVFFMVNNLVFRWPKPLLFMVWGAHGIYCIYIYI